MTDSTAMQMLQFNSNTTLLTSYKILGYSNAYNGSERGQSVKVEICFDGIAIRYKQYACYMILAWIKKVFFKLFLSV